MILILLDNITANFGANNHYLSIKAKNASFSIFIISENLIFCKKLLFLSSQILAYYNINTNLGITQICFLA